MKVAIYSRGIEAEQEVQLLTLLEELKRYHVKVCLHKSLAGPRSAVHMLPTDFSIFSKHEDLDDSFDCVISLGGDGTMLDTATLVRNKNIPILGINFGRLGFLASLGKEDVSAAVEALINGTYGTEKRTLLHLDASIPLFGDTPFGLNEFAIHKREFSPMIKIHTYLNGEFLNSYWADGLIVSTPTGSTGYNMSCNGPIVFPDSGSFVITPVAPHNLNVRSIIVPDDNIVSFEVEGRTDDFICMMDARREIVEKDVQLAVKKEDFTVKLVALNENSFLGTLREKLTWGLDKRN
ncbi:NAD kinase [Aridibaculum aurantiacum]|uniref:NAD kinase n=1 Tax=Aridibaculum aurantiacum TaxID=2810307 RepID=UPI001A977E9F|nr:NAD kinase [Aridibaculum aurantiacum]